MKSSTSKLSDQTGGRAMTPTEQDKELDEIVDKYIYDIAVLRPYTRVTREAKRRLMQLITADRKRVALEARLDELKRIALDNYRGKTFSASTNWQAKFEYFMDNNERCIAYLKAKQEELEDS